MSNVNELLFAHGFGDWKYNRSPDDDSKVLVKINDLQITEKMIEHFTPIVERYNAQTGKDYTVVGYIAYRFAYGLSYKRKQAFWIGYKLYKAGCVEKIE